MGFSALLVEYKLQLQSLPVSYVAGINNISLNIYYIIISIIYIYYLLQLSIYYLTGNLTLYLCLLVLVDVDRWGIRD